MKKQICLQGSKDKKNYFEGWYYKFVNENKNISLAVIPGIVTNKEDPHAFIQTINSLTNEAHYFKFPLDLFEASDTPFRIQIGDNVFTEDEVILNLKENDFIINGTIYLGPFTEINKNKYMPTIMGPFSYLPMQCNHGIQSLYHDIMGEVNINNENICLDNGYGYLEKDYGTDFPKKYIWLQSNTPLNEEYDANSLFLSIADVPLKMISFQGLIAILYVNNKEYRFSTYQLGRVLSIKKRNDYEYVIRLKQGSYILQVHLELGPNHTLKAPKNGYMETTVQESLNSNCEVSLYHKEKQLVHQRFTPCACEIVGYKK